MMSWMLFEEVAAAAFTVLLVCGSLPNPQHHIIIYSWLWHDEPYDGWEGGFRSVAARNIKLIASVFALYTQY